MKGFIEHVINNGDEVLNELQMEILNESTDIVDELALEFDDEFANEETPGIVGENVDGVTDIDCYVDGEEDLCDEEKSGTYDFDDLETLDESCRETMQQYQGWNDEDLEDEALFQECQECADETNLFEYGMKGKSGRKPDGMVTKAKKAVKKTAKRVGAVYSKAFGK